MPPHSKVRFSLPGTLIFSICIQTCGIVWFLAQLSHEVSNNKKRLDDAEEWRDTYEKQAHTQDLQIVQLKAIAGSMEKTAADIKKSIDKLQDKIDTLGR